APAGNRKSIGMSRKWRDPRTEGRRIRAAGLDTRKYPPSVRQRMATPRPKRVKKTEVHQIPGRNQTDNRSHPKAARWIARLDSTDRRRSEERRVGKEGRSRGARQE